MTIRRRAENVGGPRIPILFFLMMGMAGALMFFVVSNLVSESSTGKILRGEHPLKADASGQYLVVDRVKDGDKVVPAVTFEWQMSDGTSATTTLPLWKIRFNFNEGKTAPTVKFRWPSASFKAGEMEKIMAHSVKYAEITLREKDFSLKIR